MAADDTLVQCRECYLPVDNGYHEVNMTAVRWEVPVVN